MLNTKLAWINRLQVIENNAVNKIDIANLKRAQISNLMDNKLDGIEYNLIQNDKKALN